MKKVTLLFVLAFTIISFTKAQSIEDGKKFMYYERYKSAIATFQKLVNDNPNNVEAAYWLGQALIAHNDKNDVATAKALYQQTLMNNSNSALLLAGMGHIELIEGKNQDARNRFETALSLSQSKNKDVLNAIGFANVNASNGDAAYAIEKLKTAIALKNMKDPDVFINLGDAYRKTGDGGQALMAYQSALDINPNYARAPYRMGKIYQTQGDMQKDIYMKQYEDAIAKDPTYAPVYENLYQHLYNTNVIKSGEYLEKYLANTDDDYKNCYYRASMKYAQGAFKDAIAMSDECLKQPNPYSKLYGLKAYSSFRMGDSINAKTDFENYFAKADKVDIGAGDYASYAGVLLKFPGNDSIAGVYVDKALALDTLEANKTGYVKTITSYYESQKKYKEAGDWYTKLLSIKKDIRKTDLYNAGYSYYRAGEYPSAINMFNIYTQKFPEDAFGYYMIGKSNWAIDSTLEQGLANPSFQKTIEVGLADSVKYKAQLIGSYKYFIVYSVFKRDKATALSYCDKVLSLDANDAETISNKETITNMNMSGTAPKPKQAAPAKPAGKGGKGAPKSTPSKKK